MNQDYQVINTIRALSVDQVQKANSGHPGLPLGAAAFTYELWAHHMKHDPADPDWINRDRFVLSAGHGSALLYSLLHLFGYGLDMDDLKQFRQFGSRTPGHPEVHHTRGVEITTGPLGSGLAASVGMAMAEAHLAAVYNRPGHDLINHYTYVLVGDGCLQEGVGAEASSLAGHLQLDKLIVLYDSNKITIEGATDLAFTEQVRKRYEAYGFQTLLVEDGNDTEAVAKAIEAAKADHEHPSFIEIRTHIGFGSVRQDSASVHGEPLGEENVRLLKEKLGYPSDEPFYVDPDIYPYVQTLMEANRQTHAQWNEAYEAYKKAFPQQASELEAAYADIDVQGLLDDASFWQFEAKPQASRALSGTILNRLAVKYPKFMGGSADLAPSNKTELKGLGSFQRGRYEGRNLHFGIRENAMAAIGNGLMLHGGVQAFVATFFVFTDYLKPMLRLSSLMELPLIYVMTHDSIGVGEDGPTHEPIEQLTMLRAQPNVHVWRPADGTETAAAYVSALSAHKTPSVLALSRQNLDVIPSDRQGALKGGYVISEAEGPLDGILIATGSEVGVALKAQKQLADEGILVRVVSMPCTEVFDAQPDAYREAVLPASVTRRLAIEAGATLSWYKYVGNQGDVLGIDHFGASSPAAKLFEAFGFTAENIASRFKNIK